MSNGLFAGAVAAAPGSPDDLSGMLARLDARYARGVVLQLQRTIGNAALQSLIASKRVTSGGPVARVTPPSRKGSATGETPVPGVELVAGLGPGFAPVQRQPPTAPVSTPPANASMPGPNASQPSDPEVVHFEGHDLRFDRNVLYPLLKSIQLAQGLMGPSDFVNRFKNASPLQILQSGERPGLVDDIKRGLDDANLQLDHERDDFIKDFEAKANGVAADLLDKSKKTIEAELDRLGITGDIKQGLPNFQLSHSDVAAAMKNAARDLIPFASAAETTGRESAAALARLSASQQTDPFNLMNRPLYEDNDDKRKKWMAAEEAYEQQRRTRVAAQPGLAMYTDEPGRVDKLTKFAAMDDTQLATSIGVEAKTRLANIDTVKPQIGGKFTVWHQTHLQRVTLDALNATRPQREAVDWKARAVQRQDTDDKMLFSLVAIGLGLLAAIPTGGSSLLVAVGTVAAAAGAGLALYQAGESASAYTLAAAANATDFDKAKAISQEDPSGMQLALDIVGAVGDVFMAAAAFKALGGVVKAAKAGEVASALKVAEVAEAVGVKGAAKSKIVGEAVASLPDAAIEQVAHTMASTTGSKTDVLRLIDHLAQNSQFQGEVEQALKMLEHVEGRIPETARTLVKSGKVRVFTEESLIDVFGQTAGKKKWQDLGYAQGFYSRAKDTVFIRAGSSAEDLAGTLIHEATHRVGKANPLRGNDFMSEAIAEFAERDFYMTLYMENGPLAGKSITSPRIRRFLTWSDEQLMADIEKRYFDAKKAMAPGKRVGFLNVSNASADQVVDQIFKDIAADYKASLPNMP
jgi:hypothetical protein